MDLFSHLLNKRYQWRASTLANPDTWLREAFIGAPTAASGVTVTETSAMRVVTVLACQKVIAESAASLPLILYERLEKGKRRATNHDLFAVLHDAPNPEMNSYTFLETMFHHASGWGNAYAEITRNGAGRVAALWPLLPDRTRPRRNEKTRQIEYVTQDVEGAEHVFQARDVFHVPGLGFDGLVGYSPVRLAREAVGLAAAAERYGAAFFGSGARPGGVLEHPGKLTPDARTNLRESFERLHGGLTNAQRVAILEEGMKFTALAVPPEDAQFLDTRKFQRSEIAALYRVPPHMIGDLDRATFANIEQQSLEFVVYTLRPWLVRFERAIQQRLLVPAERRNYFAEFLIDGLLRGDMRTRYDSYGIGLDKGFLCPDEVRAIENLNPIPDGSGAIYRVPLNTTPSNEAPKDGDSPAAPAGKKGKK